MNEIHKAHKAEGQYYQVHTLPLIAQVAMKSRMNSYRDFLRLLAPLPPDTILDFGISEHESPIANFVEKHYPYPENITCIGIGDGQEFKRHFPRAQYLSIAPGETLPFADRQFDIAISNAVLEHVGDDQARIEALKELARVARRLFITIPNRWFPVEHHTAIPFLHWCPPLFRALARRLRLIWAEPSHLEFLSRQDLTRLARAAGLSAKTGYTGLRLGPFSSVCYLLVT